MLKAFWLPNTNTVENYYDRRGIIKREADRKGASVLKEK